MSERERKNVLLEETLKRVDRRERFETDEYIAVKAPEPIEFFEKYTVRGLSSIIEAIEAGEAPERIVDMTERLLRAQLIDKTLYAATTLSIADRLEAFSYAVFALIKNFDLQIVEFLEKRKLENKMDDREAIKLLKTFYQVFERAMNSLLLDYVGLLTLNVPHKSALAMSKFGVLLKDKVKKKRRITL